MKRNLIFLLPILFAFSCTIQQGARDTLNFEKHYTTVEKIMQLNSGNTIDDVNKTLGVKPYDVLFYNQDSYLIALYYYKHPWRIISNDDLLRRHTEGLLTSGENVYGEISKVYVVFDKSKKVIGYYTEEGNKNGINQSSIHEYLKKLPSAFDLTKFNFNSNQKDSIK